MTLKELSLLRLSHQQILVQDFAKPAELISWMGAMQAQDYNMARWAMGIRLPGLSQAALQGSIDRGEVLRTHVMRPTWHLIAAKDASWMLDLTAPHIKRLLTSRLRELELSPSILKKAAKVFEKDLMGDHHLTRDELLLLFEKNKVPTHDQRASHILMWAEIEKIICSGAIREKKNTYALFDERVTVHKKFTREEGLINLATRYFTSHGPATLQDFLNWSGLPVADGRKTIEMLQDDLFFEKIDSQTFWFKDANIRSVRESAYLLPAFDEFIIGYKDRSAYLPGKHKPTAIGVNGMFYPVIVVHGQVIGLWKRTIVKNKVKVALNYFRGLKPADKDVKQLIAEAVGKVVVFFGNGNQ